MTIFKNRHWPVNDDFPATRMASEDLYKSSLTGQWQFPYGQMSLTAVNDKKFMDICHWLQSMTKKLWTFVIDLQSMTKKLSLTAGQWQKNCHWLDVVYPILTTYHIFCVYFFPIPTCLTTLCLLGNWAWYANSAFLKSLCPYTLHWCSTRFLVFRILCVQLPPSLIYDLLWIQDLSEDLL